MTKAVIYRRVSDAEQKQGYSLDGYQTDDTRRYCAEKGYIVATELEEVHSAHDTLDTRPVLQHLRRVIRNKEVEVVVVWRFDRLARGYLDDAVLTREAHMAGVRIESATENIPEGPMGWVVRAVISANAEQEWHAIRQRSVAGTKQRVERELYLPGNRPPYGYSWGDNKKGSLVPNPETARVVRHIFDLVCSGLSGHAVARQLAQERIPSPTGKSYWGFDVICDMVNNPLYVGTAVAFRTRQPRQRVVNPNTGRAERKRLVLSGDSIPLPEGVVLPLVSLEVATRAREHLAQHRTSPLSGKVPDRDGFLLRGGLAECAVCGKTLTVRTRGATPTSQPVYRCTPTYGAGPDTPRHTVAITTKQLDDFVWASFVEASSQPEILSGALERLEARRAEEVSSQLEIRRGLLDDNRQQQAGLVETLTYLKQDTAKSRIAQQLDALAAEEEKLETSIASLERQDTVFSAAETVLRKFAALRESTDLNALRNHEKRRLLFDFGVHVRVIPVGRGKPKPPAERVRIDIDVLSHGSNSNIVAMPWPTPIHIVARP